MKRKMLSAVMALMLLLTAVGCGTAPTSSSEPEPAPYMPDPAPVQTTYEFAYDDELGIPEFTPESSDYYLLEVWGAQAGGGGGWYSGFSGSQNPGIGSGSGGSGYIDGVLLGAVESGVWQGNGKAVITWADNTEDTIPEGLTIPQA